MRLGPRRAFGPCSAPTGRSRWAATRCSPRSPLGGAPVAAVAADTAEAAAAGLAALAPELEALPPLELETGLTEQRFTQDPRETVRGDPDAALAGAAVRIELTCETPAHVQTPLEPHAAVARWDGDSLTAWVSTQGMFDARRELSERFGLRPSRCA